MIIGRLEPQIYGTLGFELEGQPDTIFTKTTYKDNPFCPDSVRRTIESYEPTPENIAAGNRRRIQMEGIRSRGARGAGRINIPQYRLDRQFPGRFGIGSLWHRLRLHK